MNFNLGLISSTKLKIFLEQTELKIPDYLPLKFWRKCFMDTRLHIFQAQVCNRVWKPWNTLLVKCNLLLLYRNKFSRLTSLQKYGTENFSILKTSHMSKLGVFMICLWLYTSEKNLFFPAKKTSWILKKTNIHYNITYTN